MIEKVIKRKYDKLNVKQKGHDNSFNSCSDKKAQYKCVNILQKLNSLGANVKVKLDLSSYATKTHLKEAAGVVTSDFSEKLIQ